MREYDLIAESYASERVDQTGALTETGQHSGGIEAALDHFEGHELAVMLVIALSQIDRAHTASPDLLEHAIGS